MIYELKCRMSDLGGPIKLPVGDVAGLVIGAKVLESYYVTDWVEKHGRDDDPIVLFSG